MLDHCVLMHFLGFWRSWMPRPRSQMIVLSSSMIVPFPATVRFQNTTSNQIIKLLGEPNEPNDRTIVIDKLKIWRRLRIVIIVIFFIQMYTYSCCMRVFQNKYYVRLKKCVLSIRFQRDDDEINNDSKFTLPKRF